MPARFSRLRRLTRLPLRDLARDRRTAPSRSAYVTRHRTGLIALAAAALAPAVGLALVAGPGSVLLLLPVAAVGLLHRRLKRLRYAKSFYVTAAWLTVVVGLPWLLAPAPAHPIWTLLVLGLAILANAVASSIRDHEAAALHLGPTGALAAARSAAAAALLLALAAPPPVRGLLPVPALTLAALLGFRSDERYGLLVVDGALLVGAGLALAAN